MKPHRSIQLHLQRTPEKTRELLSDAVKEIVNVDTEGYRVADDLRAIAEKLQPEKREAEQE